MADEKNDADLIENFSGEVTTFVRCHYHGSTVDRHEDFALDEYTLATSFNAPVNPLIPFFERKGKCTLEKFLQALPERYFAYGTYKLVDGEVQVNNEKVFLRSLPFAHSAYTFINGTLHTASEVMGIFRMKRRTKTTEAMLQAAMSHDTFVETRTGQWYLYYKDRHENVTLPSETKEDEYRRQ